MVIVSAADERFAAHFTALLHSAWARHPEAEFYLLDCGLERTRVRRSQITRPHGACG
jgi:hypothetical protein